MKKILIPMALAGLVDAQACAAQEAFSLHAQVTNVTQRHDAFTAPFSGTNSLQASESTKETTDITLYLGARLWSGGEFYLNPEIDQGFGLSNTVGIAGFPSGEAYKVGKWKPYLRLPRAFLRQTFALEGGEASAQESGANTLAGSLPANRVMLTLGKFSVVDIFDNNDYAHDPRADFLNWSLIDAGAFDYAADSWGFTTGAALEWTQGDWSLRSGYFALSRIPNSERPDNSFAQHSTVLEAERRYSIGDRPGALKLLAFQNHGRMGRYDDALAQADGGVPDTAAVRRVASKSGIALNWQQEASTDIGLFARFSRSGGAQEAFEFTEINQSLTAGLSVKGSRWSRPADVFGLALAADELSADARRYFAAGGIGILIGDGQLPRYGKEQLLETYYAGRVCKGITLTGDYQYIRNPAYNAARGPVSFWALRLHAEI